MNNKAGKIKSVIGVQGFDTNYFSLNLKRSTE